MTLSPVYHLVLSSSSTAFIMPFFLFSSPGNRKSVNTRGGAIGGTIGAVVFCVIVFIVCWRCELLGATSEVLCFC